MKIYCRGISTENIDFIVERRLVAYIAFDHAIVTVVDDVRSIEDLKKHLEVSEVSDNYLKIMFSPEMIIPNMKYILMDENEEEQQNVSIIEFEHSFFDMVINIAVNSDNLTRAEATRIIWEKFAGKDTLPYSNINQTELAGLLSQVDRRLDEKWINDEFVKLIIKYSIYITCWEKCFGHNSVYRYMEGHLANKLESDDKRKLSNVLPATTVREWFTQLLSGNVEIRTISKKIVEILSYSHVMDVISKIEKELYRKCNIDYDDSADIYRRFFTLSHRENGDIKASLYEMLLFVNTFCYSEDICDKKELFNYCMDSSVHVGDITDVINKNLTASVEIVLMNFAKINQNLKAEVRWADMSMVAIADNIQKYSIPIIITLMRDNYYHEDEAAPDIENLVQTYLHSIPLQKKARYYSHERIGRLIQRDGGYVLGSVYYYSSANDEIQCAIGKERSAEPLKSGKDKKYIDPVKDRAKSFERNYWTQRKKMLQKLKNDFIVDDGVSVTISLMKYLHFQNYTVRSKIRDEILPLVNERMERT